MLESAPESALYRREFSHTQGHPLHAVAREVNLGFGVVAQALQRQQLAFAKFGMKHLHAGAQTMCRCGFLLRNSWAGKAL